MIEINTWVTRPRQAQITEQITRENFREFAELDHVRLPLTSVHVVAVVCTTLHGEVEAQFGDHLVISDDEVYPIKPHELDARYTRP